MYVRQRVGQYSRVGVHGRSIGGVIATHLARKGMVEFLFADRTFRSLDRAAKYSVGAWAQYALPFFTFWFDTDLTTDYIFSSCYKVMSSDPNDEIIDDNASLKTGVAKKIVSQTIRICIILRLFFSLLDQQRVESPSDGAIIQTAHLSDRKLRNRRGSFSLAEIAVWHAIKSHCTLPSHLE